MNVVVSHPTGNANLRAVLRALGDAEMLDAFHTTLALPAGAIGRRLGPGLDRRLGQRRFPEVPQSLVHQHPVREIVRLIARRCGPEVLVRHETGWASVDGVYRALDRAVACQIGRAGSEVSGVYAYEDGALESFRAAKERGMTRFYDLPIAHWATVRRLLEEEAERLPEWVPTMQGLRDSVAKHARKDEEIRLADRILVASSFTRDSLERQFGHDLNISTIPYGCPPPLVATPATRSRGEPIRLLYAGHLAQRKGLADLIFALDRLEINWHLTLAGPKPANVPPDLDRLLGNPRCNWLGVVPHQSLLEVMTRAHAFVFPSIVEGFGMVITEALAAGLPVITTPHTAGPDILTEGQDGFIVPIRDADAIAERITRLSEDESQRAAMAESALATAARVTWARYERSIVDTLKEQILA